MSGALESDRDTYNKSHETNRGIARLRSYPCMYACFFALCNDVSTTLLHNHKDIWTPHSLSNYESPSRSTQDLLPFLHSIKLQKHPFLPYTYSNSTSHSERAILTPQQRELPHMKYLLRTTTPPSYLTATVNFNMHSFSHLP